MKIGLTFDKREDYGIEKGSEIFADFCNEAEVDYIADAIRTCGYDVELIGNMHHLNAQIQSGTFDCDLVFVEDEGIRSRNRELIVPALLELNEIPYIGSDAYAMGLSQNKYHTKLVARSLGIQAPGCICVPYERYEDDMTEYLQGEMARLALTFPLVVKPNYEGYSMGVFKVASMGEMIEKVKFNMKHYRQSILCEEYIAGDEVNVPIVGTGRDAYALGIDRCKHADGTNIDIFSLSQKCFEPIIDEVTEYDARISATLIQWSLDLHRHFCCNDFSRPDFKVTEDGRVYFIEFNPRPGLTQGGPFEACARAKGKSYSDIIGEIIESARRRVEVKL